MDRLQGPLSVRLFEIAMYCGIVLDATLGAIVLFTRDIRILRSQGMEGAITFALVAASIFYFLFLLATWLSAHKRSNIWRFGVLLFVILSSFTPRNITNITAAISRSDPLGMFYVITACVQVLALCFLFSKSSNAWFRKSTIRIADPENHQDMPYPHFGPTSEPTASFERDKWNAVIAGDERMH